MWGYRLQDVGTNCSEMLLFQALLNCPCSQGALLFLMKQHFLGFDIWTKAFWASLLSKCVCSKDGHGSCHPIYLMFVFASAVILEVSYTCATFSVLSLLLLHDLEMEPRPWPPVMHAGGLAFELDGSTNGINSCFSQRTDSLCGHAVLTWPSVASSPCVHQGSSLSALSGNQFCWVLRGESGDVPLSAWPSVSPYPRSIAAATSSSAWR